MAGDCPRCGDILTEKRFGDIALDGCSGCGGIWFDAFELQRVDEVHEAGDPLLEIRQRLVPTSNRLRQINSLRRHQCRIRSHEGAPMIRVSRQEFPPTDTVNRQRVQLLRSDDRKSKNLFAIRRC